MGFRNLAEIKKANSAIGHHWFEHDRQREHRVESDLIAGRYWIESAWNFEGTQRNYALVEAAEDGSIQYLLAARRFDDIESARAELDAIAGGAP